MNGWSIVARTLIVYGALLFGLRLAGKRELGQMTPFDLVVILLIANAVQNAMVGSDTSVSGGLIAAGVLIGVNFVVAETRERVPFLRRAIEGTPTLLIHDGAFIDEHLGSERLNKDVVMMAIREHGIERRRSSDGHPRGRWLDQRRTRDDRSSPSPQACTLPEQALEIEQPDYFRVQGRRGCEH